jgi:hypothetical protein
MKTPMQTLFEKFGHLLPDIEDEYLAMERRMIEEGKEVTTPTMNAQEIWELACTQTLKDISDTFASRSSDSEVFQAISEMMPSFPILEMPKIVLSENDTIKVDELNEWIDKQSEISLEMCKAAKTEKNTESENMASGEYIAFQLVRSHLRKIKTKP